MMKFRSQSFSQRCPVRAFSLIELGSVGTGVVPFHTDPNLLLRLRDHVRQAFSLNIISL